MIRRLLISALVTSILACPFTCKGNNECCAKPRAQAAHHCCERFGSKPAHSHDQDSQPAQQHSGSSQSNCQCICGGAVVQHDGLHSNQFDLNRTVAVASPDSTFAELFRHQPAVDYWGLSPDDGKNVGRAVRCRLMSLLC